MSYQLNPLLEAQEDFDDNDHFGHKVGIAGGIIGANQLLNGSTYDDLMGTVTRYHNTASNNVEAIKEKGLLSKFASDPNNITNKVVADVPMSDKEGLVYVSKNKNFANSVGLNRSLQQLDKSADRHAFRKNPLKAIFNFGGKTLKIRMSPEEYAKLVTVENPELRHSKNPQEFYYTLKKLHPFMFPYEWDDLPLSKQMEIKQGFKGFADQTVTVKGDISPKHIVGSKHYQKATNPAKWAKYVKNNPGKFARGVGKAGLATGGIATAGILAKKIYDDNHKKA